MKILVSVICCFLLVTNSFAMDIGCVVGDCENKASNEQEEMYECICPPKDTIRTILDVVSVLTLPFELLSKKPYLNAGADGINNLIKHGCKCRLKIKKHHENEQQENKHHESETQKDEYQEDKRKNGS